MPTPPLRQTEIVRPWNGWPAGPQKTLRVWRSADSLPQPLPGETFLPFGLGRSLSDVCLNPDGTLLRTPAMDRLLAFDETHGVIRCEAGVTLRQLLEFLTPRGWFLPTTPGTSQVTVGGAIANDVHGKDHHRNGSFGCHVTRLELLRSDGRRIECSPDTQGGLFLATIGGLGLTGLITWAEFRLKRMPSPWLNVESVRFGSLEEWRRVAQEDGAWEYTVAWLDGTRAPFPGLHIRGNFAASAPASYRMRRDAALTVPCDAPGWLLQPWLIGAFNRLKLLGQPAAVKKGRQDFQSFFYPLDQIGNWSRLYGRRGYLQYQFAAPHEHAMGLLQRVLETAIASRQPAYLVVLKTLGSAASAGLLSFPMPGLTAAIDFPNLGKPTLELFGRFDEMVRDAKGRLYPAKDPRMPAAMFRDGYPEWREFSRHVDPAFSSGFWRRVVGNTP
ncbi:MAG: FAD-binding oxidoreductase [Verrucomicrobia bacterium]|nr:FAD-binding oxidoreductase [Verrucomicrobiota bacterium]